MGSDCRLISAECITGEEIRQRRELVSWTQYDLSRATGISRSRLSEIECGHVQPPPDELRKVERAVRLAAEQRSRDFERVFSAPAAAAVATGGGQ
ncbi:hypothetical protein SBA2_900005 [Acidobacteriia bacterium SbA2]|nr:hypothetical protein SBA2_900005 [Acidobacteriia bacterium SbA2]